MKNYFKSFSFSFQDSSDPKDLLSKSNIDKTKLVDFTLSAVNFATDHQLPPLEFKKLSNGDSDIALFDFTSIKKAANASRIIERKKQKLAMALVGDSLIEVVLFAIYELSPYKKMKFSIKNFFSKCDQIRSFLRIWSHLLKKSVIEKNYFLCSVGCLVLYKSI